MASEIEVHAALPACEGRQWIFETQWRWQGPTEPKSTEGTCSGATPAPTPETFILLLVHNDFPPTHENALVGFAKRKEKHHNRVGCTALIWGNLHSESTFTDCTSDNCGLHGACHLKNQGTCSAEKPADTDSPGAWHPKNQGTCSTWSRRRVYDT